jgi:hypothetical protein
VAGFLAVALMSLTLLTMLAIAGLAPIVWVAR